eukprot:m.13696 g.13696  ORF g.13696 m.13696 type:complete len:440 (+) comp5980_c0_seq1:192-1511(+)
MAEEPDTKAQSAFRGTLLDMKEVMPLTGDLASNLRYVQDGLLLVEEGKITFRGTYEDGQAHMRVDCEVHDFRGKLITPGFIDSHIHYAQMEMMCAHGEQLLQWLETYTFPTELKYKDYKYAKRMARRCLNEMFRNGTTTAVVFCTVHSSSVDAFFEAAEEHNMRVIAGKVLMDRNAPEGLRDTPQSGYEDSKRLIEKWHGKGRALYAITPRFAPTSSSEQLELAGQLKKEYPSVYVHTHLSENTDEIAWVKDLFPECDSYYQVYQKFGLTGPRCVFAHCVHLSEPDVATFKEEGSVVAFCPTSNLFLGSGLMPFTNLAKSGVLTAFGSDVGAGTSFSMMQTFHDAYKVVQLQRDVLSVLQGFYLLTLGGAHALELDSMIGSLDVGKEADFVVIDPCFCPLMQLRWDKSSSLEEKLFALFMLGNEQCIYQTVVAGHCVLP